jgi:hypothetical protein
MTEVGGPTVEETPKSPCAPPLDTAMQVHGPGPRCFGRAVRAHLCLPGGRRRVRRHRGPVAGLRGGLSRSAARGRLGGAGVDAAPAPRDVAGGRGGGAVVRRAEGEAVRGERAGEGSAEGRRR